MEEKIIAHGGRIAPDERSNGPGVPGLCWILYLYSTTATLSHHKNEEKEGRIEIKENDNALQKQKKKKHNGVKETRAMMDGRETVEKHVFPVESPIQKSPIFS